MVRLRVHFAGETWPSLSLLWKGRLGIFCAGILFHERLLVITDIGGDKHARIRMPMGLTSARRR